MGCSRRRGPGTCGLRGSLLERGLCSWTLALLCGIVHGKDGAVMAMFDVNDGLVAARIAKEADSLVDLLESIF
jgi:hypothetical protein